MSSPAADPSQSPAPASDYQDFLSSILSDRERFFTAVVEEVDLGGKLRHSLLTLLLLSAFYGAAAGAYSGSLQAVSAGVKLPLLLLVTLGICFPAFYVVQILVGSRLRLLQVLVLVLASLALTAILLAAFVPISVFFLITGANYHFLQLLHVIVVLTAGLLGMYALHDGLTLVCEKRGVYPKKAITIMRVWTVLFAFVGIQVAWNLRPFLGERDAPFTITRDYEGNFYAAIIYSLNELARGAEEPVAPPPDRGSSIEGLLQDVPDSAPDTPPARR
jgi:hypothetical protein